MFGRRQSDISRSVAIELCDSTLKIVVFDRHLDDAPTIETHSVQWRRDSPSLLYDNGRDELAAAFKQLVAKYKLQGQPVYLALNGDYCVTRVVTGSDQEVKHELAELEHRSALYLTLGHGQKALGGSVRQIDARRQHALLTVVNQKVLDAIVEAAKLSGVILQRVEPSLVSLCRLVGHMGGDADGPALIATVGQRGVELGITHRGQPLLDYRPAGKQSHLQVADIVASHLGRLQRYCDRYVQFAKGTLSAVYLCGEAEAVEEISTAFAKQNKIAAHSLDPASIDKSWKFTDQNPETAYCAALGACLLGAEPSLALPGPNLLERLQADTHSTRLPSLMGALWPVAAMLLLALGIWGLSFSQQRSCEKLEQIVTELELPRQRVRVLQGQIIRFQNKSEYLAKIESGVIKPNWSQIALDVSQCLPDDVWLDSIQIDSRGNITVSGISYNEDGVFEFVNWLRQYPRIEKVALGGTQSTRLPSGPATRFDVVCVLCGS